MRERARMLRGVATRARSYGLAAPVAWSPMRAEQRNRRHFSPAIKKAWKGRPYPLAET